MSHSSKCRYSEISVRYSACRSYTSSYVSCSRTVDSRRSSVGSSRPEFHYRSSCRRTHYPAGLCRYKTLMIYYKEDHRLYELSLHHRASYRYYRFSRKYRSSFRNSPYIAGKFKVFEIFQKIFIEDLFASQIFYIFFCKLQSVQISYHLFKPCHHSIASVIRYLPEKHIEIRDVFSHVCTKIPISHGHLIKISQHRQV